MNKIDTLDEQLVRLLGRNARQNSEALAKKLNVSSVTIRRRLRELIRKDTLRIVGVVDPAQFVLPMAVVMTLDVENDRTLEVLNTLAERPEITWVSTTAGRYDMVAVGRFSSSAQLSNFLQNVLGKMSGIKDSETLVCLDMKKAQYVPLT